MSTTGNQEDPLAGYNFLVEVDGEDSVKALFTEVSGLKGEAEEYEIKEGGLNTRTHKLPGRVSWGPITLKKGVMDDTFMRDWWRKTVDKPTECRKNVTIVLLDRDKSRFRSWSLANAWPKAWEGASFTAASSDLAIESLVLNHDGVTEK